MGGAVSFNTNIRIKGTIDDKINLLKVLKEYEIGNKEVKFPDFKLKISAKQAKLSELDEAGIRDYVSDDGELKASTVWGPYGRYVELNDINIFREMSEVAPDAFFEAEITGCTDYTEQSLKAVLMNRRLKITQTYEENDEVPEAYLEYIIEKLPYRDFLKFFKLSSDDLDEDLYEDMMNDIATETWDEESLFDMEYDDFIGTLEAFDVETELEKEDYDAAVEAIRELNIESGKSFAEGYQGGSETTLLYDPIVKAYI